MRTAGSILVLIILVPASLAVFFVFSLKTNVLTAKYVKRELVKQQAYAIAEDQLSQHIATMKLENLPISNADIAVLAQRVLSAPWLQQQVEGSVDRLFTWFNAPEGAVLALPIDLRAPKAQLLPGVDNLIATAIPKLPACTKNSNDICRTPGLTVAQVKDQLQKQGIDLATITTQLPDSVDLANPVLPTIKLGDNNTQSANTNQQQNNNQQNVQGKQQPSGSAQNQTSGDQQQQEQKLTPQQQSQQFVDTLTKAKTQYHKFLKIWMYILLGYIVLILGFLAINMKGWHRLIRWKGILGVSLGILPLVISIASKPLLEKIVLPKIDLSGAPTAVQTAVPAAILDTQHALMFPILLFSSALVLLGIAAIIGAKYVPASEKRNRIATVHTKKTALFCDTY